MQLLEDNFQRDRSGEETLRRRGVCVDVFVQYDEPWRVNEEGGEYADTLLVLGSPKQKEVFNVKQRQPVASTVE